MIDPMIDPMIGSIIGPIVGSNFGGRGGTPRLPWPGWPEVADTWPGITAASSCPTATCSRGS